MRKTTSSLFCLALCSCFVACGKSGDASSGDGSGASTSGGLGGESSDGESSGGASGGHSSGGSAAGGGSGGTSGGSGGGGTGGGSGGSVGTTLSLDASFGTNGEVTTRLRDASDDLVDVVRQADGKLVAIGTNASHEDVIVYRFNVDGDIDTTFNGVGSAIVSLGIETKALAVALQSDGKIVALMRHYSTVSGPFQTVVMRFLASGALDTNFGTAGRVNFGGDTGALEIQPDDKLLVATSGIIARLTPDGAFDSTFGTSGQSPIWPTALPLTAVPLGIGLDGSGRVFVASYIAGQNVGISCLTSAGVFDTSFDGEGGLETGLSSYDVAFAVQADGKPLLASSLVSSGVLARYDAQGALDTSFSGDGYVSMSGGAPQDILLLGSGSTARIVVLRGSSDALYQFDASGVPDAAFDTDGLAQLTSTNSLAVTASSSGGLILAGFDLTKAPAYSDSYRIPRLVAVTSAGALDSSWAESGRAFGHAKATLDEVHALALAGNGAVIAAGRSTFTSDWASGYVLAKYDAAGALDPGFGTGGVTYLDRVDSGSVARGVGVDSQGRVIVAGGSSGQAARLTASGQLDTSFGSSGIAHLNGGYGYALAIDSQDRFVIGGSRSPGGQHGSFLVRGGANGLLDASFGTSGTTTSPTIAQMSGILALALTADEKILVTGAGAVGLLTRYDANGQLDGTFQVTDGTAGVGRAIDVAGDGTIVVAGTDTINGWDYALDDYTAASKLVVGRFLEDGSPDTAFGGTGLFVGTAANTGISSPFATGVRILPEGDVYVAGTGHKSGILRGFVVHVKSNGTFDAAFGTAGVLWAPASGAFSGLFSLLQKDQDTLLAGGFAYMNPTGRDFALVQLGR